MSVGAWIVLGVGTALIVAVSWPSLRQPRSHGFPRFFAFELILVLAVLNAAWWFKDPFSALQLVSWAALIGSAALVVAGARLLRRFGQPETHIETTTRLVTVGLYRYIRHPLYASLVLLDMGALLKHVSLESVALALAALAFLVATARLEERESLAKFGPQYAEYMKRSRMFIPYIFLI